MYHHRRRRSRLLALVAAAALLLGACSDDGDDTVEAGGTGSGSGAAAPDPSTDTTELCSLWSQVYEPEASGEGLDEEFMGALERSAPPAMGDDVATFVEADRLDRDARADDRSHDMGEEELAAVGRVMGWIELECAGGTRVAPPLDALPAGLEVCGANAFPPGLMEDLDTGQAVVYAPADAEDPFGGPVVVLMWGGDGGFKGDGDGEAVTLREAHGVTDAVIAPITAFQQVVLPDLGTVVAWTEDGEAFGLYGRGWPRDRADELVAVAESMQRGDGDGGAAYDIPTDSLPDGFTEVVRAPGSAVSIMHLGSYTVTYRAEGAAADGGTDTIEDGAPLITLSGSASEPGTEDLWRLLTLSSERIEVAGRTVSFTADGWGEGGPVIASWRTGDGHVSLMGFNVDEETVLAVVEASRELADDEWLELTGSVQHC